MSRRIYVTGNPWAAGVWNVLANRPTFFAAADQSFITDDFGLALGRLKRKPSPSFRRPTARSAPRPGAGYVLESNFEVVATGIFAAMENDAAFQGLLMHYGDPITSLVEEAIASTPFAPQWR
jgi:hypothetical protein